MSDRQIEAIRDMRLMAIKLEERAARIDLQADGVRQEARAMRALADRLEKADT